MLSRRSFRSLAVASVLVLAACGSASDDADGEEPTASDPATDVVSEPAEADADPAPTVAPTVAEIVEEPAESESEPGEPEVEPVEPEPEPEVEPEVEPEPEPAETDPAPTEPEPADSSGSDPSCLVGEWIVTQDEMNAYYDAIEASFPEGPTPTFDIEGNVLLTFTETDYIYVADFDLTLDVVGQTGTGDTMGTVTGTWEVVDGLVVTTLGESDLEVNITVGGVTLSGSELVNGLLDSVPINDASFDCAGPTISFQTGDAGGPGHDVLLTPA